MLKVGDTKGFIRKYKLIGAKETEFEGAKGTMLTWETKNARPNALNGEQARNITVRNTPASGLGTRIASVEREESISGIGWRYKVKIFIPAPLEDGPNIGVRVQDVVRNTGLLRRE